MVKRCIYCNVELEENAVVDICQTCMYKVWGPKMSQAIISNMEREKPKGNLELGRVGEVGKEELIGEGVGGAGGDSFENFSDAKEVNVEEHEIVEQLP